MKVNDKVIFLKDIYIPPYEGHPGRMLAVKDEAAIVVRVDKSQEYGIAVRPEPRVFDRGAFGVHPDEVQVVS